MNYVSTRNKSLKATAAEAIAKGISEEGGLFVPDTFKTLTDADFERIGALDYVGRAKEILKLGMYIGIGGVVTFNNAKKLVNVVKEIPLERILLETDAPYLSPVPFRGEINDSSRLFFVAEKIAEIKNTDTKSVLSVTKQNAKKLYNI